jgi:glutathione peroxidase
LQTIIFAAVLIPRRAIAVFIRLTKNIPDMKKLLLLLSLTGIMATASAQEQKSFYDFSMKTIDGKDFSFSQLKGKKVMIVNTASMCGYTPQYAELEKLHKEHGGEKFVILGFPANNFGEQEPGSNQEIKEFCAKNYGVTFQMFEKISVKGEDMAPLYQWLTEKSRNGVQDAPVKWNFQKFLVDENGKWAAVVGTKTSPLSDEVLSFVKK